MGLTFEKSERLISEAKAYLPGGVGSDYRLGPAAIVIERGEGPYVFDADGNRLIDYYCGSGPVILGHNPTAVVEAVSRRIATGVIFAAESPDEFEAARLVTEMVPCAERARFGNTGSEIVHLALRLARGATGRPKVAKLEGHYHGWFDGVFVGLGQSRGSRSRRAAVDGAAGAGASGVWAPPSAGVDPAATRNTVVLPWNDAEALRKRLERRDVAALILEPLMAGYAAPLPGYLEAVRAACTSTGTLLIFDEIVTGFRVGPGGAQELFGVTPDLAAYAKALANGFPVSCLAGRAELMDLIGGGPVIHAGTYNGNALSMSAAVAVLTLLRSGTPYETIERAGGRLMSGFSYLLERAGVKGIVQGVPATFNVFLGLDRPVTDVADVGAADGDRLMRLVLALRERGVRAVPGGHWYLTAAHSDEVVDATLNAFEDALAAV